LQTFPSDLTATAAALGYPVALKAQAAALMHKTEAGGVALSLADSQALEATYAAMIDRVRIARPEIVLDGVLVEKMSAKGVEIALGVKNDAEWGPMLMIALGGVLVEVLHDIAVIPLPVTHAGARRGLESLRAYPLLQGARDTKVADVEALLALIVKLSTLLDEHPEISEMDLNPVFVHPEGQGVTVVDASIVVGPD
jgi:acetate---CoA ligase (ADP-forming)